MRGFRSQSEQDAAALEMLKAYFLLLDARSDGEALLRSVTKDPIAYISSLDSTALESQLSIWDKILRRQSYRLYNVGFYFSSQSYLAVIAPELQAEAERVIGNKMNRVVTLHGIGANLFFRSILPIEESPEEVASTVLTVLTKKASGIIDHDLVSRELADLGKSLSNFSEVISESFDRNSVRLLSDKAREATQIT